jgi:rod shape-determining protein MreC
MNAKLWEQVRDWVLLAVLLLVSLVTLLTQNQSVVRSVRAHTLEWTARVESGFAWMGRYFRALEENDELRRRNIELSSEVARSRAARLRNQELEALLELQDSSRTALVPARIVAKDIAKQENFLTLDVGARDSVAVDMPVIHPTGIVGTVVLVSAHYARVMSFLNTKFRVPAEIQPLEAEGIVRWDGENLNRLVMEHVVKTEPVERGQSIVTSGHSGVFPAGRRIGTVDSVNVQPGRNELRIYVRPAVSLYSIKHVFVLRQRPDVERQTLEAQPVGRSSPTAP